MPTTELSPEQRLIRDLRDPNSHAHAGLASTLMLQAEELISTRAPRNKDGTLLVTDAQLVHELGSAESHITGNRSMPMLFAAQRIEQLFPVTVVVSQ